jgi:hypothetical protein
VKKKALTEEALITILSKQFRPLQCSGARADSSLNTSVCKTRQSPEAQDTGGGGADRVLAGRRYSQRREYLREVRLTGPSKKEYLREARLTRLSTKEYLREARITSVSKKEYVRQDRLTGLSKRSVQHV